MELESSAGDTNLEAGQTLEIWDLSAIESCHCVEGSLQVEAGDDSAVETMAAGTVRTLHGDGPIRLTALEPVRLIFTFTVGGPPARADWRDG